MTFIITLIVLGLLFLVAEIILLPGLSIAGIFSLICYCGAIYLAVANYGISCGIIVIIVIITISIIAAIFSLRSKTWQRFALNEKIKSSSMTMPESKVKIGDHGVTISRLAPMGKVEINGEIYEAKSIDSYVDPKRKIEVIAFENFNVIVKTTK